MVQVPPNQGDSDYGPECRVIEDGAGRFERPFRNDKWGGVAPLLFRPRRGSYNVERSR